MKRNDFIMELAKKLYYKDPLRDYQSNIVDLSNLSNYEEIPWENIPSSQANGLLNDASNILDIIEEFGMKPPRLSEDKVQALMQVYYGGYSTYQWDEDFAKDKKALKALKRREAVINFNELAEFLTDISSLEKRKWVSKQVSIWEDANKEEMEIE